MRNTKLLREVLKAEQKWQRSVEHYLRKWNVDVVMRRKVLNETVDIQIYKSETCEVRGRGAVGIFRSGQG